MSICKVSDYIVNFLVDNGIKDLFLVSGGGMMHLLDSAKKNRKLNLFYNLNEQASAICAESYSQITNNLGACMVTTGPGATNAITGCAGAWVDSTPVFYISGQCKREQMGQLKGLRIYGAQEIAITQCVKPITKYAVTIINKNSIAYHLEKALYLAINGRKGPVWIDVPLDIQGSYIETKKLKHFVVKEKNKKIIKRETIKKVYGLINESKRPVILIGHGVIASRTTKEFKVLIRKLKIPVLSTWRAKSILSDDDKLFFGCPGAPALRYSNYVLQNADLLIVIGSRLNPVITAYDEKHFAYNAKKIIIDIESKEIEKLDMRFNVKIVNDAGVFIKEMNKNSKLYEKNSRKEWLNYCNKMKEKYSLENEIQQNKLENKSVNGYEFAIKLSKYSKSSDVFVGSSSGRTCGISHMAYKLKNKQRFITSMGLGSMGWCIPSSIAVAIATKKRTIVIEGDGSLQHNIQELQLINTYKLPIKIFVYNNNGYASIKAMQTINFNGRLAGCDRKSRLSFPNIKNIAKTYNLKYFKVTSNKSIDYVIKKIMSTNDACLCEILGDENFDEIPKSITIANNNGTFTSSKLENLYPFVSSIEQKENMPEWNDK